MIVGPTDKPVKVCRLRRHPRTLQFNKFLFIYFKESYLDSIGNIENFSTWQIINYKYLLPVLDSSLPRYNMYICLKYLHCNLNLSENLKIQTLEYLLWHEIIKLILYRIIGIDI